MISFTGVDANIVIFIAIVLSVNRDLVFIKLMFIYKWINLYLNVKSVYSM